MAMPMGHKAENGYSTVAEIDNGLGYREIAEQMSTRGHKMNHSTARNVLVSALSKLASNVCNLYFSFCFFWHRASRHSSFKNT